MIYFRTDEGQQAAYSSQSALPRKLKSILKVIDGKTSTEVFERNLHSFGDVRAILRSLEMAGLLGYTAERATDDFDENNHFVDLHTKNQQERDWSSTHHPLDVASLKTNLKNAVPFIPTAPPSATSNHLNTKAANFSNSPDNFSGNKVLESVLNEMADFVLMHSPEQSFQILKEIEEITSLEVLAATLGGYEQMVSNLGKAGADHLNSIKSTLREHL